LIRLELVKRNDAKECAKPDNSENDHDEIMEIWHEDDSLVVSDKVGGCIDDIDGSL
jgi:hypothetical protein